MTKLYVVPGSLKRHPNVSTKFICQEGCYNACFNQGQVSSQSLALSIAGVKCSSANNSKASSLVRCIYYTSICGGWI